ncbi:Hypothetical predicted protein [Pelobates cultripes]|uniref:Uncharacterized protein n=1 Tax=Pelobates cultripes TaxID=61616 RepID=A0AAD1RAI4_PELCU|nr:Hypothetical predicted protein [Pelobates cultripes]
MPYSMPFGQNWTAQQPNIPENHPHREKPARPCHNSAGLHLNKASRWRQKGRPLHPARKLTRMNRAAEPAQRRPQTPSNTSKKQQPAKYLQRSRPHSQHQTQTNPQRSWEPPTTMPPPKATNTSPHAAGQMGLKLGLKQLDFGML